VLVDEVAVLQQERRRGLEHRRLAGRVLGAHDVRERTLLFGERPQQRGEGRPVDVEGRERVADEVAASPGALRLEPCRQQPQDRRAADRRLRSRPLRVAVASAQPLYHLPRRVRFRQHVERDRQDLAEHHQPPLPAEALLAAQQESQPEELGPLRRIGGQQARLGRQALGQQDHLRPAAARLLVLEDGLRGVALARPGHQLLVGVAGLLEHPGERNALHVEEPLGSLAPGAGDAGHDEAQAGQVSCLLDVDVVGHRGSPPNAAPRVAGGSGRLRDAALCA
jgi:hypothetical protein